MSRRRELVRRVDRRLTTRMSTVFFAISCGLFAVLRIFLAHATYSDLKIYQIEGMAIRNGWNLYGALPGVHGYATYPPFAAIVFAATTPLSVLWLEILNAALTLGLLAWICVTSCRLAGRGSADAVRYGLVVAALTIWCEPVFTTLGYGQINVLLLALVVWDFSRPADSRYRGIGVGLAAGLKVTPGVFIVYLFLTRRYRHGFAAAGVFAATLGLSFAMVHQEAWRYWTDYLFDSHRVGRLENAVNQTIRGMLVRIDHTRATPPAQELLVVLVFVLGMATAVYAYRRQGELWGLCTAAITGLLCSPISWSHHWVWCVPAVTLIAFRARAWLIPTVAVFWSFAVWVVPHHNGEELHFSVFQIAISEWYVLWGLCFIGLSAWTAHRTPPGTTEPTLDRSSLTSST